MKFSFSQHRNAFLLAGLLLTLTAGIGLGYLLFRPVDSPGTDPTASHIHEAGSSIWTCSMHPQIRQNEAGACPICGMDLIPLADSPSDDPFVLEMTPEAVKLAQVETTVIGTADGPAEKTLRLSGKIEADERRVSSLVAHIPGRIEQLWVSFEGEFVKKGQAIARIYSPALITAQQELFQAQKLRERNPGLYEAARQKLTFWKLTEQQIEEIETGGEIQETFEIYAGASGVVTQRRISVGDYVQQGATLFDLVDLSRVWVLFDAYEADLPHIRIGDRVRFSTPSVPGHTFSTPLTFIDPAIDPGTRVASVRGEIANPGRALKPGMFVKGSLVAVDEGGEQLMVPRTAVLWTGTRSVVYVKEPGREVPSFRFQEIELGERTGDFYRVQAGLQPGDEVVTQGSFSIDAAAQLNNQASMINRMVRVQDQAALGPPDYAGLSPAAFKGQLNLVVEAYLPLKDALVASDPQQARNEAQQLMEVLKQLEADHLQGESRTYWENQAPALRQHATAIGSLEDLDAQRESFGHLSQVLIATLQALGNQGKPLFVQHCPMAFDYQGADWLSTEEMIRNPYFGDAMLTCGEVKSILGKTPEKN